MTLLAVLGLACASLLVIGVGPASAVPPFPVQDSTNGTPGTQDPNWTAISTGNTVGNTYTSDGWLRLTGNGTSQATNILNNTAFPSSTGFQVTFDYRQAGGSQFNGRTGDGLAFYLVDGTANVSAGAAGSGLGYARGAAGCGVTGGYLGLGLDVFGNYAASTFGSSGGDTALNTSGSEIGLRGSGPGTCAGSATSQYPWVAGAAVPGLWTGTAGNTNDPATEPNSQYRRVTVTVAPAGGSVQVTVQISNPAAKSVNITTLTQVFSANLSAVTGQVALPATLKLGFSASTGAATDYHDIRIVRVAALTDAALTKTLSASTPGHAGYPAGTFLPGDPISFTLTATNNGPTTIGNPPDGVARVFDDLSGLPISGASWTCAAAGGATCDTGGGSGAVVSENWHGPTGGRVVLTVTGTVTGTAGTYANTAVIPTNFTNNTVDPTVANVQLDGGAADTNLANNTASAGFTVLAPHFTQTKTADQANYRVGDPITYTLTVNNTGTGPGTATVADPVPATVAVSTVSCAGSGGATCTAGHTANSVSGTVTAPAGGTVIYTITGTVVGTGTATNTATVTVTTPDCPAGCGGGPATTPPVTTDTVGITLTKSATANGQPVTDLATGQLLTYSFLVTNSGTASLTGITVNETSFDGSGPLSPVTCPTGPLVGGASETCTATYTVTQADVDAGHVTNTATATGTPPAGPAPVTQPSTVTSPAVPAPALTLDKSVSPDTVTGAGQSVTYSFVLTNTGNVTLTDATVNDSDFSGSASLSPISCPPGAAGMLPGARITCTATYVSTQADIDAGQITNTATATATPPSGPAVTSPQSTAAVTATATPTLSVTKTADPSTVTAAQQLVTYHFNVTNTGNVTVTGITVTDDDFTGTGALSAISCPPAQAAALAPGASLDCTATYAVTQADIDAGSIDNTATAHGNPPAGGPINSPPGHSTVGVTASPALSMTKTANPSQAAAAGAHITYSFVLTNTGNVTLTDVHPVEGAFSGTGPLSPITCPTAAASMAPGDQVTCTAAYTLTQADADAGSVTNIATETGTSPAGDPPPDVTSPPPAIVTIAPSPTLSLHKSAAESDLALGEVLHYSFVVTNTGNVTLVSIAITETAFTGHGSAPTISCPAAASSLAPGAQVSCTSSYTVTQADVDAGSVNNTATAHGTPPSGPAVASDPSSAAVPSTPHPALTFTKSATPTTVTQAGDVITYHFSVENTGNLTLTNVAVDDSNFSGTGALSPLTCSDGLAAMAPAAIVTCTASYRVTQADVDAGSISNSVTGTGTPPAGDPPPTVVTPPPVIVTIPASASLSVVKSTAENTLDLGATLHYSFVATNTGNVTLTDVTVDETAFTGSGTAPAVVCPTGADSLAPGDQLICTATYIVTQADVDAGIVNNTAVAHGSPPTGGPIDSAPSSAAVPSDRAPGLSIVKTADPATATRAGDAINYHLQVVNTGNVTITNVAVDDINFSGTGDLSAISCPAGAASMLPGAVIDCTATYTVTQADADAGHIDNTATVTGTPPVGTDLPTPPSSSITTPIPPAAGLSLVKTATPTTLVAAGQTVTYNYLVTNTGNVTLTDIGITETSFTGTGTAPAPTCTNLTLAPGAQQTCSATYTATQADIDTGRIDNTATAHGTPPTGNPAESQPGTAAITAPAHPGISVVKSATPSDTADFTVGQTISYSFVVTNTGNVTLTDVAVDDSDFTGSGTLLPLACGPGLDSMAPAAQTTCTTSYTIVQSDIDAGHITNAATVTGTPPSGNPVDSPQSTVTVPEDQHPAMTVIKSANTQTITKVGQQIDYQFLLTNTGNVTLANARPVEGTFTGTGQLSAITCPSSVASMLPGAQASCTASYTVTQADLDAGHLANTATATATPPPGAPTLEPPAPSTVSTPSGAGVGQLSLAKKANATDSNNDGRIDSGDRITWTITVTNSGAVTVTHISVSDPTAGTVSCPATSLAPGTVMTCTVPGHTITRTDANKGKLTNTATAAGEGVDGARITPEPATATVTISQPATPALAATGTNSRAELILAWLLLGIGGLLILAGRRRELSRHRI